MQLKVKMQRSCQLPLVVHTSGNSRNLKTWDNLSQVHWSPSFRQFLSDRNIDRATELQGVLWPLISRVSSVVAVGPRSQGKTLGWLLPIDSLHLRQYHNSESTISMVCQSCQVWG